MAKRAFTFPGQGSQAVGMGKDLAEAFPEARAVFDEVDEALGQKLSAIMFEGPAETLQLTENAQPALMAVVDGGDPRARGQGRHASRITPPMSPAIRWANIRRCAPPACSRSPIRRGCCKIRGQAMQQAVPVGQGAMAAILGLDLETVLRAVNDAERGRGLRRRQRQCAGPGRDLRSCRRRRTRHRTAQGRGRQAGAAAAGERAVPLRPDAAGGRRHGARAERGRRSTRPSVPVVVNVLARPTSDPDEIKQHLVEQVTGMVRWTESVSWLTGRGRRDRTLSNSAPARCSPASPSASRPTRRPLRSTPRPISTRSSRR